MPPLASTVNYPDRRTTSTASTVMLDDAGDFCLYSFTTTDVLVDLFGLYQPEGAGYRPLTPTRFVDTRAGEAAWAEPEGYCDRCRRSFFPPVPEPGHRPD